MTFLCYQSLQRNSWTTILRQAMTPFVDLPTLAPTAPEPFSLGDPNRTREILKQAGYRDIQLTSDERLVEYAPSVEEALDLYQTAGPLTLPLANISVEQKAEVPDAIHVARKREIGEGPVRLGAATWIGVLGILHSACPGQRQPQSLRW